MSDIQVAHNPADNDLQVVGVFDWPLWEKEVSRSIPFSLELRRRRGVLPFTGPCHGDTAGRPVRFGKGDLVTFPAGMACHWEIHQPVIKHYSFR